METVYPLARAGERLRFRIVIGWPDHTCGRVTRIFRARFPVAPQGCERVATHANDPREPTRAGSHGSFPPSAGQHVSIRPDCGIALRWKSSPYTGGAAVLPPKVLPLMLLPLFADPNVTSELKAFPLNRLKIRSKMLPIRAS